MSATLLSASGTFHAGACPFYDGSCSCASSFLRFLLPDVFTKHVISCGHLPDVLIDVCGFILDSGPDTH